MIWITDSNGSLLIDASGTAVPVDLRDGAGNALTSAARGSERALSVQLVDAAGGQITSFAGTEYTDGDADATPTGVAILHQTQPGVTDTLKAVSTVYPLPVNVINAAARSNATDSITAHQGGTWSVQQGGVWTVSAILEAPSGTALTSHSLGSADALDVCVVDGSGNRLAAFPVTDNSGSLTVDDGGTTLSIDDGGGAITVDGTVAVSGTVAVQQGTGTAATANVSASASSVTLLTANADRVLAVVVNDSTADLYVKFGTTASTTSYSYLLGPADTLEVTRYTGRIDGIWSSAAGSARVTEVA